MAGDGSKSAIAYLLSHHCRFSFQSTLEPCSASTLASRWDSANTLHSPRTV